MLITGLSGAGRSAAAAVLEDLGFYVVDNLPTSLLATIVELASQAGAASTVWRSCPAANTPRCCPTSAPCAPTAIASRSCSSTRRRPSWSALRRDATQAPAGRRGRRAARGDRARARSASAGSSEHADLVIDTTDLNVHQLKDRLVGVFERRGLGAAPGRGRELRLQARAAARRRHRDGRAVPAEPALGRRRCARSPVTTRRSATTCSRRAVGARVPRPLRAMLLDVLPALPGRGAELPDGRDRLHRRTPPIGGDRRGDGAAVPRPRRRRAHVAPRRRRPRLTVRRGRPSARSPASTGAVVSSRR